MWTCPKCKRPFKSKNQWHACTTIDEGALFLDKPDDLVLAYDAIVQYTKDWTPNTVGTATKSIVFTSKKAWLIVKPMKSVLDVKFYNDSPLDAEVIKKVTPYGENKYAHHIRIGNEAQLTNEVWRLLKIGF